MLFCRLLILFSKINSFFLKKKSFRNTIRVSNSLDPDQARRFVGPDLNPSYEQKKLEDKESTRCNGVWYQVLKF